jgi:hypothetical protein
MVPLVCRVPIVLASLLVPRRERKSWKQEWYAELSYRQRSGATLAYMFRSARGAFRDAMFIRAQKPFSLRFLHPPLRVEYLMLAIAVLVSVLNSAIVPPRPRYPNLDRLVRLVRDSRFLGTSDQRVWKPLLKEWAESKDVKQVASYQVYVSPVRYARVTPNFFEVLGVPGLKAGAIGAGDTGPLDTFLLRHAEKSNTAVVTYQFWRKQLRSNPHALGSTFHAGGKDYTVTGILSPGFAFNKCLFFAPLGTGTGLKAIALLQPGVGRTAAETGLRNIARGIAPEWRADDLSLQPLRAQVSFVSILLVGALATLAIAYLCLRKGRMKLYVWARIAFVLFAVTVVNLAAFRAINNISWAFSILQFWVYLSLCAFAVFYVQRDQRSRCPTCQQRLRMPVSIGSWSSLILDRPTTEYVCPKGHGALVVSEALHDPDHWTVFDESWRELFVETGAGSRETGDGSH